MIFHLGIARAKRRLAPFGFLARIPLAASYNTFWHELRQLRTAHLQIRSTHFPGIREPVSPLTRESIALNRTPLHRGTNPIQPVDRGSLTNAKEH
ncbi:hypothetical protein B0H14DRAFT_2922489 [Mycena olivaceomarginata]|nr:hypothetical protein B0H14DRAFT_2922489 [Mycena olivaceomarginata]